MNAPVRIAKDAGIWARQGEDWYVEPEWCSRRLFETEPFSGAIFDPACGMGRIVKSAHGVGLEAYGTDKADRGATHAGFVTRDFLSGVYPKVPNIVTNPPFDIAEQFVTRALSVAVHKVAMLLPATWHFGSKRSQWLETTPLKLVLAMTPRPSMPPGHVILGGEKPGGGTKDFSWYIWEIGHVGPWEGGWLRRD